MFRAKSHWLARVPFAPCPLQVAGHEGLLGQGRPHLPEGAFGGPSQGMVLFSALSWPE